jgi:hypothetical protein
LPPLPVPPPPPPPPAPHRSRRARAPRGPQPIPPALLPADLELLADSQPCKCKKWTAHILHRMLQRYGNPKCARGWDGMGSRDGIPGWDRGMG